MGNGKAAHYAASAGFLYGALTLPSDLHGYATMIGEAWPVIAAFLPLIGTMLAVSAGVWISWNLVVDLARIRQRAIARHEKRTRDANYRETHERQELVKIMRFVATNTSGLDNVSDLGLVSNPELASRVRLGMDYLIDLGVVPRIRESWSGLHSHLRRLIPIVEICGIEEARRLASETENTQNDEDSAERC